ncbi:MAG: hypothetical protein ACK48D_00010 [Pseudanabaena sp.]
MIKYSITPSNHLVYQDGLLGIGLAALFDCLGDRYLFNFLHRRSLFS